MEGYPCVTLLANLDIMDCVSTPNTLYVSMYTVHVPRYSR